MCIVRSWLKPRLRHAPRSRAAARRRERAQGTVELAVILPLLLVLVVGVIEVAEGFNAYTTVVSAARDGARLGSKGSASDAAIQALVVTDLGRLKNLTPASNVTVTHTTTSGTNSITVKACYNHTTFLHVPLIMPNSITMCSQTTMPSLN
ncbi:MAG TPA: TadE/TadG family type IV pilus assembly protein [Dehalococcoidia bacterium]|nr:TadE/TadG family type IV pilus assembly protein [Dehalococcoidia bacterium]